MYGRKINFSYLISGGIELNYVQPNPQINPLNHFVVNSGEILWNSNSQTRSSIFSSRIYRRREPDKRRRPTPSGFLLTVIAALALEAKPKAVFKV